MNTPTVCEILSPAGSQDALEAGLAAGADAVYFGLDDGFNARARASNFSLGGIDEITKRIHRAGARAYLTLNTLIFEAELPRVEEILVEIARSGVDALIVQDPGLALLAQEICPELELHASTQMTISSPEAAPFAAELGITRVVVPRELSVNEIRKFKEGTDLELEVFIMGALCVSWSGQCLSSEAWGGRSANRGQCAQACRLPYDLIVDGEHKPLGNVEYLLSPKDLAGFRAVKALLEIGVHTLKVEGRQKNAAFVNQAVGSLRRWVDSVRENREDVDELAEDLRDLSLVYSRGSSDGFLAGSDHQSLVEGEIPRHRGLYLGRVDRIQGYKVLVDPDQELGPQAKGEVSSPLPSYGGATDSATGAAIAEVIPEKGMGVVFYQGDDQKHEQGGPIFKVSEQRGWWWLSFGKPGPDLNRVRPGAKVYVTSDPRLAMKKVKEPTCQVPISLEVTGKLDEPLRVVARWKGTEFKTESSVALQTAQKRALDEDTLWDNLGALGGTPFYLELLDLELGQNLFLPLACLREIRREIVERFLPLQERGLERVVANPSALEALRGPEVEARPGQAYLVALCRNDEQLEAAIAAGVKEVELDWMELIGLNKSVERAREAGMKVGLATVRVQKPGEEAYDRRIEKLKPETVLLRHWAGLMHFRGLEERPELHGDFSLNVTNSITANHLLGLGLHTVTASHDLDQIQLKELLKRVEPSKVAVTVHHHIPTFHTEHCVYSHLLSQGRDYRSCGRPCEEHKVSLKDRMGQEHPVIVDVGCRNTVFNAKAQSAAFLIPKLVETGVERMRIEFVRESRQEAEDVLRAYSDLLKGDLSADELVSRIDVHEQFGVTRGTMDLLG